MSIVAEILTSRGKAEIGDLSSKISELSSSISDVKHDVKKALEGKYLQFKPQLHDNKSLCTKLTGLSATMDGLKGRIEREIQADLQNSTSELKTLSSALQEMNLKLSILKQLVDIDTKLNAADKYLAEKSYYKAAQVLCEARSTHCYVHSKYEPEILKGIKADILCRVEFFIHNTTGTTIWKESIVCEKLPDVDAYNLAIKIPHQESFAELVQALYLYDVLNFKLKFLSDSLMENIFVILMRYECEAQVITKDNCEIFHVKVLSKCKAKPDDAIKNVKTAFLFLKQHLEMQMNSTEEVTFLNLLGQSMSDSFCELFIKDVLADAIPSNKSDLTTYEQVIDSTKDLQECLEETGFLSKSSQSILDFAKNVDVHFANKLCELTLKKARTIMLKDLHDTQEIKTEVPDMTTVKGVGELAHSDHIASLSSSILLFPQCVVSKSAIELVDLVKESLKECSSSSELRAVRLFYTARKVIEMYYAITPAHHKKFLDSLPQQAALFHNNCMYIAHQLLLTGPDFSSLLSSVLPAQSLTFADLTASLRQAGSQVFLGQMQIQRRQLLDILRESGLSTLGVGDGDRLPLETEKCLRQCLRQLELLQRVWQNVLPTNVYNKAIGTLLNTLVEELVVRVCSAQDIPVETASDLVTVLTTVLQRAPRVLLEAGEVHQHVKKWRALEELVHILQANLLAVDDRWGDGKGPLAHEFSPDQVRNLIRALFMNSEKRATLLAKIK